ncbi:DUF4925 domain-containing protein [Bacteroides congonensis]|uniref:DUF4925 domain-containing protein n=1 Tax=Bacteroides congonensis TaxID=1871006 RepID=UPI0018991A93|nr:DUF4925 domain-containing protein [Bacteroides congonensis]
MKNKLFYLIGVATFLCYTSTFTSCINGVDDEYLELVNNGGSGNSNKDDEAIELPDLNGDYVAGGEFELVKMTYNGEELTGKAVNIAADEQNQTATITLTGTEQDLTEMLGGLMEFKFTTLSPVPGVKEIILPNVKLYNSGTSYLFKGEVIEPTYILSYEGTIEDGKMNINLKHELVGDNPLAGTWILAPLKDAGNSPAYAPLWFECDSKVKVDLGKIQAGSFGLPVNQPIQGIISLLTGSMSSMIMNGILGQNIKVEQLVLNMLRDITAEKSGSIFATYSYSEDVTTPQWSSEMSHNILRYYYGEEEGKFFVEANADFLANAIGGLIPNIATSAPITRAGDPEQTKAIGRELVAMLIPLLRDGIPCEYTFDNVQNGELAINIEGECLRKLLLKVLELANDEYAKTFVEEFINSSLGDFAGNIKLLLQNAPAGLTYYEGTSPENYSGECGPAKLGLKFVRP